MQLPGNTLTWPAFLEKPGCHSSITFSKSASTFASYRFAKHAAPLAVREGCANPGVDVCQTSLFAASWKAWCPCPGFLASRRENQLKLSHDWLCYLAPEIVREMTPGKDEDHLPFSKAADVYAFGWGGLGLWGQVCQKRGPCWPWGVVGGMLWVLALLLVRRVTTFLTFIFPYL